MSYIKIKDALKYGTGIYKIDVHGNDALQDGEWMLVGETSANLFLDPEYLKSLDRARDQLNKDMQTLLAPHPFGTIQKRRGLAGMLTGPQAQAQYRPAGRCYQESIQIVHGIERHNIVIEGGPCPERFYVIHDDIAEGTPVDKDFFLDNGHWIDDEWGGKRWVPGKPLEQTATTGKKTCSAEWQHEWKEYNGFIEFYEYCVHCDKKRDKVTKKEIK